jgi:hypothetical protein
MGYGMSSSPIGGTSTPNVGQTSTGNFRDSGIYREGKEGKRSKIGGYHIGQEQKYGPEAMQLYQQLFGLVGPESYLARLAGGDESMFEEMEAPAFRQFNALQGNIASRFSGQGGGKGPLGSQKSSGFQNTMNQASSQFAQDLASRRNDLKRQAILDLMGISSNLLEKRPYETIFAPKSPKKPGFWDTFGQSFAQSTGESLGTWLAKPGSGGRGGGGGSGFDPSMFASMA